MLSQTFVHLPGVGAQTERRLWSEGCADWDAALANPKTSFGSASKTAVREELHRSKESLRDGIHQYFAKTLKAKDVWRAWSNFSNSCVYLDIETDGAVDGECITVVGCWDGSSFRAFLKGEDMESFRDYISRYSMVVTYFGGGFDLPVIDRRFPGLLMDQIHIDLCPALRTIGYRGGLKRIEKALGIERSPEIEGLDGWDAVKLWRQWLRGNTSALETLIAYNKADCVNLEPLARHVYSKLREDTLNAPLPQRKVRKRTPWYIDDRGEAEWLQPAP